MDLLDLDDMFGAMSQLFASALLVEDEPNLAIALSVALKKLGIPAQSVSTLAEAQAQLSVIQPEFVLLDRSLPDGDGLDLCAHLRKEDYAGSILILTASGRMEERVLGLNTGADDYLAKPFSWEELEARIRALARRKNFVLRAQAKSQFDFEIWHLDPKNLRVLGPKGWVELTPLEFKLAARLIENAFSIVTRSQLLHDVWGFTLLPKTRTVDHFLGRLRKYFEENPEEPKYFLTIRGAGYKFQP